MFSPSSAMSWGYHTIFPPHKYTQDKTDSPPHSSDADDDNAADNRADNDAADNDADDNADINADNNDAMQTTDDNADAMQCRRRMTTQTTMPPPRPRATMQMATTQTVMTQPQTSMLQQRQ